MWQSQNQFAATYLQDAAISHGIYFTYRIFAEKVSSQNDDAIRAVLDKLCVLYGLQKIIEKPSSLYETGFLTGEQLRFMKEAKEILLRELRNDSLSLLVNYLR